jgi:hypothetical protein
MGLSAQNFCAVLWNESGSSDLVTHVRRRPVGMATMTSALVNQGVGFVASHSREWPHSSSNDRICLDDVFTVANVANWLSLSRLYFFTYDECCTLHVRIDQLGNPSCAASRVSKGTP